MNRTFEFLLLFISLTGISINAPAQQNTSYEAAAIAEGNLAEAEQGLLGILDKDPNDPYALLNLAYVYQKSGDTVKAQQVYQRILELKSNPHAELASGKPEPVKNIARRGIARLEQQPSQ